MIEVISRSAVGSPHFESVTHGFTCAAGRLIRPAEMHSHIVISRGPEHIQAFFVGPWESATELVYGANAEIIWIRLQLGVHLRYTPSVRFRNCEHRLNSSSMLKLCLEGETFGMPTISDVDGFLSQLSASGVLTIDPIVQESVERQTDKLADRSVRYRFLRSVGLSKRSILQIRRAQQGVELVSSGLPIADVALSLGYYDQAHFTRNMRKYIGHTPGILCRSDDCRIVQDNEAWVEYNDKQLHTGSNERSSFSR